MANSQEILKLCFSNPAKFYSCNKEAELSILQTTQQIYTETRSSEKRFSLEKPKGSLQQLYFNGLNSDQIYEQIALNDKEQMNLNDDSEGKDNLYFKCEEISMVMKINPSSLQLLNDIPIDLPKDEGLDLDASESDDASGASDSDESDASDSDALDASAEDDGIVSDQSAADSDIEDEDDMVALEEDSQSDDQDEMVIGEIEKSQSGDEVDSSKEEENDESEQELLDEEDSSEEDENDMDEEGENDMEADSDDAEESEEESNILDNINKKLAGSDSDEESEEEGLAFDSEEDSDDDDLKVALDKEISKHGQDARESDSEEETPPTKKAKKDKNVKSSDEQNSNPLNKVAVPSFSKTSVDSKFFSVRESEWIADADIIGANNFADIDFMAGSDEENTEAITYEGFFDAPATQKKTKKEKKLAKQLAAANQDSAAAASEQIASQEDSEDSEGDEAVEAATQIKSAFEKELEAEVALRTQLEETNVSEKPWTLQGEVKAADRPEDSVLSEYLEYRSGLKHKPVVDDALTHRIERLVIQRFRTKTFDSVERKAKLVIDPYEYKKKLVLDEQKSSKSLSKIYEDEYLSNQQREKAKSDGEELPIHKEIKQEYKELEHLLNSLSNAHYTPHLANAEVRIVSNIPAMMVEEATPDVAADTDVLAPQEILAPERGEFKADSEKTATDKKHERRIKKHRQHLKSQREEKTIQDKTDKAKSEGRKLDRNTTSKVLQKAIKAGQITQMSEQGKAVKSSTSFFSQLQETHQADTAANKRKRQK